MSCRKTSTKYLELDRIMEAYYDMLVKYWEELTTPLQEAMHFIQRLETQLNTLSNGAAARIFNSERVIFQCPDLERVHASGCRDMLVGAIQTQVHNNSSAVQNQFPFKRMADGSKRICDPKLIFLTNGARKGVMQILNTIISGERDGVITLLKMTCKHKYPLQ